MAFGDSKRSRHIEVDTLMKEDECLLMKRKAANHLLVHIDLVIASQPQLDRPPPLSSRNRGSILVLGSHLPIER